jgi:hypothetical protein
MFQIHLALENQRRTERGAALVTTLMLSALLLTAGGMLILTTTMTGLNTIDAAAESQAYYGAEAGIQAALNVMRGGVLPNPLFVANPAGTVDPENRIDFTKALTFSKSNLAGEPTTAGSPKRLSRWLTYNFPSSGIADRVGISDPYNPLGGIAYSVVVSDPDNTPLNTVPAQIPLRMLVQSTGYGPRGARKQLSMLLSANVLDIDVPAALVIRGSDSLSTNAYVDFGNGAKTYSGIDNAGVVGTKPTLAVSGHDVATVQGAYSFKPNAIKSPKLRVLELPNDPAPGGTSTTPTPWFLQTAANARTFLTQSEVLANSCAAWPLPTGSPCIKRGVILSSLNGWAGTATAPQFTIVKGDCDLAGGSGLLIVTGTLYFNGSGPNFDGVILVLGAGRVLKKGGGNRDIFGSIMVARFGATGDFLDPTFDYDDGVGTSNLQYDSTADHKSIVLAGAKVLGVVEK